MTGKVESFLAVLAERKVVSDTIVEVHRELLALSKDESYRKGVTDMARALAERLAEQENRS